MSEKYKTLVFRLIMVTAIFLVIVIAEFIAGYVNNISNVRKEKFKFLGETAPLITSTNHLIPYLNDNFLNEQNSQNLTRSLRTDQFGLVLGPSDNSDADKKFGILFLGGSTTENNEVDQEFRFPYLSTELLSRKTNFKYYGVNAGVRGHTTQDSINLYLNHPSPLFDRASIVVVMHNINDRLRLRLNDSYKSNTNNSSPYTLSGLLETLCSTVNSLWNIAESKSNFFFLLSTVLADISNNSDKRVVKVNERILDKVEPLSERHVGLFKQNYINLISLIKANKKTPILMTQPLGVSSREQDKFNSAIREVAAVSGVQLIDLASELTFVSDKSLLFYDDGIHFNNEGSKWASEIISNAIVKEVHKVNEATKSAQSSCRPLKLNGLSFLDQPLYKNVFEGRYPSFDPAEKKILFQTNNKNGSSVSILDVDSGSIMKVIQEEDPEKIEHPSWIDSSKFIYTRKDGDQRSLFIHDLDSKISKPLNLPKGFYGAIPYVDNRTGKIYLAGYFKKNNLSTNPAIYVIDKEHGKPVSLTDNYSEYWRPFLAGNTLYFINNRSGVFKVYSKEMAPNKEYSELTTGKNVQWDPAISSDNKLIAYAEKSGNNFDLILKSLSNKKAKPIILKSSVYDEWDPRFSQSGKYLLYSGSSPYGDQIRAACINDLSF